MMKRDPIILMIFFALWIISQPANGCSTFFHKGKNFMVFGRNFDWHTPNGLVMINMRNVKKVSLLAPPEKPAKWTSKYGSITFNQIGKEFPFGGMNEKGLVVECLWLDESEYPAPDERPSLNELQWIQFQLDNFQTVEEVLRSESMIRITQPSSRIHWLVTDRQGNVAAIEFLEGGFVHHSGNTLPVPVLTNDTYSRSIAYLNDHKGFGGEKELPTSKGSLDRFVRISEEIRKYGSQNSDPVQYAFEILASVASKEYTQWSIVYDLKNYEIHFKTLQSKDIKTVRLKDFDFSCHLSSKLLDIDFPARGKVNPYFKDFDPDINRSLIYTVFKRYREEGLLTHLPNYTMEFLANYPNSLVCEEKKEEL